MEEIEKLRSRVDKDPNSRLFLPLAEEYRKAGLPDEAISVILSGLERQPGYTSARVALGRIYLEKGMVDEARNEFEAVVKAIPDNLFAHRKLADIYRDGGEVEKAIAQYETVINLNPLDDDAKMCLSEIMGGARVGAGTPSLREVEPVEPPVETGPLPGEEVVVAGESAEESEEEVSAEFAAEAVDEPEKKVAGDFEKFRNSFPDVEAEVAERPEEVLEIPDDQVFELSEEVSFEDAFPVTGDEVKAEDFSEVQDFSADLSGAPDLSAADPLILEGNYFGALEVYKKFLTKDPNNKQILQRIVELKTLMKLTGKGGEALVASLETFLDAVKRGFPKRL
ncbi:MAG TPA: tetratricopeptide repeat protein [Thermodesulfovibrionales bacterium]|nr:tetratricopeptide repeat protein [Thermodesulfovibrionales bacterium]